MHVACDQTTHLTRMADQCEHMVLTDQLKQRQQPPQPKDLQHITQTLPKNPFLSFESRQMSHSQNQLLSTSCKNENDNNSDNLTHEKKKTKVTNFRNFTKFYYMHGKDQQTSVPTLKRKAGSASIRLRSIEQDLIAAPRGQADPYN